MSKVVYTNELFADLPRMDPVQLQGALLGYLAESDHNSWEGYTRADLTGVRRLLADFALVLQEGAVWGEACTYGAGTYFAGYAHDAHIVQYHARYLQ